MTTRSGIAAAFRAGKVLLWDGIQPIGSKSEYICNAILFAARKGVIHEHDAEAAEKIVMHRIGNNGSGTARCWLGRTVGWEVLSQTSVADVQYWRHRWLDSLIEEFSK